ncbi:hypothetical protein H6F61_17620 [Cyanobacteria bacterium FACHB-472]|nr:hypothetical protein [Cyanobacteria bacterium FACHB-472]
MSLSIPLVFSQKLGCLAPVAQSRFHSFGPSFQGSPVGKVTDDDIETDFLEPAQVNDSETPNNGEMYL